MRPADDFAASAYDDCTHGNVGVLGGQSRLRKGELHEGLVGPGATWSRDHRKRTDKESELRDALHGGVVLLTKTKLLGELAKHVVRIEIEIITKLSKKHRTDSEVS